MYIIRTIFIVIMANVDVLAQTERCPKVKPVPRLDLNDINGTWYEVARYSESSIEKTANGSVIIVKTIDNNTLQYNLSNVINGSTNSLHGTISLAPDAGGQGVILYSMETEAGIHMPNLHVNILALDPKKYLILYDCQYDEKIQKRHELTWISARDPHVHQDIEDTINAFINLEHVIDNGKLYWERPSDHLRVK